MAIAKFLLKIILIPLVLVAVLAIGIIVLVKVTKSRKASQDEIEAGYRRGGFQQPLPPLTYWAGPVQEQQQQQEQAAMVQKPEAVAYKPHGYVDVQPTPTYAHQQQMEKRRGEEMRYSAGECAAEKRTRLG